ncbi:hypothetical protein Q5Y75_16030 [Ruegeria sp. 2205SS24-7]|uniref:hypothetical protein n=1 Tax=Ruegeria discodermiae TaxID=3064389 RepID=UPI002741ADD0|nr:hypothetical protein [Ruegeria sp. 2205SS24-7]MDP5218738.1 hypothetical protein [Ruegeria sp. 2205SS24-7]
MAAHDSINLIEGFGLEGEGYATGKGMYSEFLDILEITLIENETLVALERDHGVALHAYEHVFTGTGIMSDAAPRARPHPDRIRH